jgi:hypothetical protein
MISNRPGKQGFQQLFNFKYMLKIFFRFGFLMCFLLFPGIGSMQAQGHNHRQPSQCQSDASRIDSITEYVWDSEQLEWQPVTVRHYSYLQSRLPASVTTLDYTTRDNISKLEYVIENDLVQSHYLYKWKYDDWQPSQYTAISYDDNLYRTGLVIYRYGEGIWKPLQQAFYANDESGKILIELRQNLDPAGSWYDFSKYYFFYDSDGYLDHRFRIELKNNDTIYQETCYYDDDQRIIRLSKKQLLLNKATDRYEIPLYSVNYYTYNDLQQLANVLTQELVDGIWLNKSKSFYYYNYTNSRMVPVCHHGHTIYISRKAVRAHLRHGDCLGECAGYPYRHKSGNKKSDIIVPEQSVNLSASPADKDQILIYPNPASGSFTVDLGNNDDNIIRIEMYDLSGRMIKTLPLQGDHVISINENMPEQGMYILKFYGSEVSTRLIMIE